MPDEEPADQCSVLMSDTTEQAPHQAQWLLGHNVLFRKSMFDGDAWLPGGRPANITRDK